MVTGFAMLVAGGLLLEAGISGRTLVDTVRGIATANHRLKLKLPKPTPIGGAAAGEGGGPSGDDFVDSILGATGGMKGKSPKGVIDSVVLPIARKHGARVTPAVITAKNAVHGPTSSGGLSDHQGPPSKRWAADLGTAMYKNGAAGVDATMKELAEMWGFPTHKGLQTKTVGGKRVQLIWQTDDHLDHGHVGVSG